MSILNSPLECAIRLLVLLDTWYPLSITKQNLIHLDYAAVHSADFGGPESLHPELPDQISELAVKHELVSNGLKLLMSQRLCRIAPSPAGIQYVAGDSSSTFLRLLSSNYVNLLTERAFWLLDSYSTHGERGVRDSDGLQALAVEIRQKLGAIANGEQ